MHNPEEFSAPNPTGYSGHTQLIAMSEARNYNAMLENLLERWLFDRRRLLDIGAGTGEFTARMLNRGHDVIAVEPDGMQRTLLRSQGILCVGGIEEIARNGVSSFDGAYSLNVLEHIEDDVAALRVWAGVLKPGGVMVLYVPAFPVLYSAMDRAVGHYRRYTRASLEGVARQAGLTVVRSGYADSLGFPASLALRARGGDGSLSGFTVRTYDSLIFPVSQALDGICGRFFGKNVWLVATKPDQEVR
jgi:SAM-dependent methyltransferase